jgi:hypothetical protein
MSSISSITFTCTTVLLDTNQEISVTINPLGEVLDYRPLWYELPSALRQLTLSESQHEALADLLDNYHERLTYALPLMTLDYCRNYKEELPEGAKSVQRALQAAWPSDWERGKYEGDNEWQIYVEEPELQEMVFEDKLVFVRILTLLLGNLQEQQAVQTRYSLYGFFNLVYIPLLGLSSVAVSNLSGYTGANHAHKYILPKVLSKNEQCRADALETLVRMQHIQVDGELCDYLEQQLLPDALIGKMMDLSTDIRFAPYISAYLLRMDLPPSELPSNYSRWGKYLLQTPGVGALLQQVCVSLGDLKCRYALSFLSEDLAYHGWIEDKIISEISFEQLPQNFTALLRIWANIASSKSIPYFQQLLSKLQQKGDTELAFSLPTLIPVWRKLGVEEPSFWVPNGYWNINLYPLIPVIGQEIIEIIAQRLSGASELAQFTDSETTINDIFAKLLEEGSTSSINILTQALDSRFPLIAQSAMRILGQAKWPQIESVCLRQLDNPALRVTAMECLCWLQPDDIASTIHQKLPTWSDAESKIWGWYLLGCLGDAQAVEPLCTYLRDSDDEEMKFKIIYLCAQRQYQESAPLLHSLLKNRDTRLEGMILYALGQLRYEPIRQELSDMLNINKALGKSQRISKDIEFVGYATFRGLSGFGAETALELVDSIGALNTNLSIKMAYLSLSLKVGYEKGIRYFNNQLDGVNAGSRNSALFALRAIDHPDYIEHLVPLLSDPYASVREGTIFSLYYMRENIKASALDAARKSNALHTIDTLLTNMTHDTAMNIRELALRSLSSLESYTNFYNFFDELFEEESFPPKIKINLPYQF